MTDPTAVYLARRMIAEHGYRPGTFPEAKPLADAADFVLTLADRLSLRILLVVDRESNPDHRFKLPLETIVRHARECLPYTGEVNGRKVPVSITIWDVGPGAVAPPEFTRNRPGDANVVVTAWALDTASKRVTSTARLGGLFAGRRFLERALREPRLPDDQLVPRPPAAIQRPGFPWLTCAMIAGLVLVFAAEFLFAVAPWTGALSPDILTLIALGGLAHPGIAAGEWFRLWTAATLHGSLIHLVFNCLALLFGGALLEGLLGRAWLLALFMLGALGGSLLSYILNPADQVSVGASGAIMGLLAAAFVSSFRLPDGPVRVDLQGSLMRMGIPALLPLMIGIDYAGHLGGALTGAALGLLLLRSWPRTDPLPRFRRLAQVVGAAGLLVLTFGFVRLAADHATYTATAKARTLLTELIPDADLPKDDATAISQAEQLVARHPRDPRARLANAFRLAGTSDLAAAEAELRRGLDEREILDLVFPDRQLETGMRAFLVELLQTQGKPDAAREAAAPVCSAGPDGAVPEPLRPFSVCP